MKREPKNERGERGRGRGRKETFLPHPVHALLLAPFFARSLVLGPRSLLLNRTETLATQASVLTQGNNPKMTKIFLEYLSFEGMVEGRNYLPFCFSPRSIDERTTRAKSLVWLYEVSMKKNRS